VKIYKELFSSAKERSKTMQDHSQEKEYLTLAEVGNYVGVKKASLYYYINMLEIKIHKFNLDKRAYISLADAKRIKEIKDKPWTAGEKNQGKGMLTKEENQEEDAAKRTAAQPLR
jgi:hypothetical protein